VRDVEQVAIVGAGDAGCRLAQVAALAGCAVRLFATDPDALDRAQAAIRAAIDDGVSAGRLARVDRQRALDGILSTTDLDEAVTHADLVVEATDAAPAERRALFMRLGEACRASALVATVAGAPDDLIDYLPQPGRLIGLRLRDASETVEIVAGIETSPHALGTARRLARRLAREAVVVGQGEVDEEAA
jgi:3-hydroxyacyl-CoA dehydrogenase